MPKFKVLFLLIFCFVFTAQQIFAWDDIGHKTVAYIAWQKMTPQARAKAIELLRSAPEDSSLPALFAAGARDLAAREQSYFVLSSYWSDMIRDRDLKARYKYHHGTWHYLDTYWRDVNGTPHLIA